VQTKATDVGVFSLRLRRCQQTKPLRSALARVAFLAEPGEEQAPQVSILQQPQAVLDLVSMADGAGYS
jgi:hypothetical protein